MKVSEDLGLFVLPLMVLGCSVVYSLLEVGGYVETPLRDKKTAALQLVTLQLTKIGPDQKGENSSECSRGNRMKFALLLLMVLQIESSCTSKTSRLLFLLPEELVYILFLTTAQLLVEPKFLCHTSSNKQCVCASIANILTLFFAQPAELLSMLARCHWNKGNITLAPPDEVSLTSKFLDNLFNL